MMSMGQASSCPVKAMQPLRRESPIKPQSQLFIQGMNIPRLRCTLPPPRSPTPVTIQAKEKKKDGYFGSMKYEIPYKLDLKKKIGHIFDCMVPVVLRYSRHSDVSKRMLCSHTNNLQCMLVKRAFGPDVEKKHEDDDMAFYRWPEKSFDDFVMDLELHPIEECDFFGKDASYIPEEYREIVKDVVKFTVALHKEENSLDEQKLSVSKNLAINKGHVVLYDYDVRPIDSYSKRDDYLVIADLIEQIFEKSPNLPSDMKALLIKMRNYSEGDEELFTRHISLMSHTERVSFFKSCSDSVSRIKTEGVESRYEEALEKMVPARYWIDCVTIDSFYPLREFYRANQKRFKPADYFDDYASDAEINYSMFRFSRNFSTHIGDLLAKASIQCSDKNIDIMIMTEFGRFFESFQERLHEKDILHLV